MGSIKDKTAIIGVGCTRFGELWEKNAEDLIVEAAYEAMDDAGVTPDDIEAAWVGNLYDFTGLSGSVAAEPLKLFGKPTTRVENFCASGMDAFRNACFAVASGAYDVVLACGVEKLMDVGGSGLPGRHGAPGAARRECAGDVRARGDALLPRVGLGPGGSRTRRGQEPRERRPPPQGPLPAPDHARDRARGADDRLAARALRQLRHVGRRRGAGGDAAGDRAHEPAPARLRPDPGECARDARLSPHVPLVFRFSRLPGDAGRGAAGL